MTRAEHGQPPELPGLTFLRRLGTGGYAEVFLYEQANTRLRVAVKVLFAEHVSDRSREQFAAEAKAMAELADHPYIVQVFQADVTSDGRPYLVMKYYPQRNLALRARSEKLSVPEVLQIGVRISCAVETAHRAGILHRDIKPANILTSQYGEPGLTDFGIATRSSTVGEQESEGLSIPWSAPEVVFATSAGDRTADVYSLGATMWHLLAGRSPFEVPGGDNTTPALMRRIREEPVPRTGRDDVPVSLERLLAQAMAKRPADRPATALQLARSLQAVEAEQRWAPTPLVLLEDGGGTDDGWDGPGEVEHLEPTDDRDPLTRRRAPQTVPAQRPAATPVVDRVPFDQPTPGIATVRKIAAINPVPPPLAAAGPRPTRARHGVPAAPEEPGTVRRPVTVAAPPAEDRPPAPTDATPRRQLPKVLALSGAVAVAAVAIAVALSGHSAKPTHADNTNITGPAPTLVVAVPNSPVVTGARTDPGHVSFHWSEPGAQPGDQYYWQEAGGAPHHVTGNSVTIAASTGQKVCITVQVARNDGTELASSAMTCAG